MRESFILQDALRRQTNQKLVEISSVSSRHARDQNIFPLCRSAIVYMDAASPLVFLTSACSIYTSSIPYARSLLHKPTYKMADSPLAAFSGWSARQVTSMLKVLNMIYQDTSPNWPYFVEDGLHTLLLFLLILVLFILSTTQNRAPRADKYPRQFVSSRGNEYFCEIDEEYLTDRFNLTGLNTEVHYYQHALDLINDVFDLDCDDEMRELIEKSARHLYGLVHARYIVTTRGLAKMVSPILSTHFPNLNRTASDLSVPPARQIQKS